MISKYIIHLLETQNRVIVPDLGAFLRKGNSMKTIYFNEFLRYNDEILLNFISQQEKIEKTDAARLIKQYSNEILQKLQSEKTATLDFIGTLIIDKNDKIVLHPLASSVDNESDNDIFENGLTSKNEIEENKLLNKYSGKQYFTDDEDSKEVHVFSSSSIPVEKKSLVSVGIKNRFLVVGLVLLFILIICYFLFNQSVSEPRIQFNPIPDTSIRQNVDHDGNESLRSEDKYRNVVMDLEKQKQKMEDSLGNSIILENKISSVTVLSKNGNKHKYYLIAGFFSQESNANILLNKLIADGYKAEKLNLSDGHFYVAYASYVTRKQATERLHNIKSMGKKDVWMYHF